MVHAVMTAKQTQLFLLQEQRRGRCYCPATGGHQEESSVVGAPQAGASSSFTKVLRVGSSAAIVRQRAMRANPYPMQSQQHQSTTPSGVQDHACLQSGGAVNKDGLLYQQNKLHQALRLAQQTTSYVMKPWGTSETACSEASTTVPSTAQHDGSFTFSGSNPLTTRCSSTFSLENGTTTGSCIPYLVPAVTPVEGAKGCEGWEQQQRQQHKSIIRENGCGRQVGKGVNHSQCGTTAVKLQSLSERDTDSAASTVWPSSSASSPTASPASLLSTTGQPDDASQDHYGNDPDDSSRALTNSNQTATPATTPTAQKPLTPRATPATPVSGLSQPVEDLVGSFHVAEDGYIVTPGQHRIHINNFLMEADLQAQGVLCGRQPAAAAMASYAQDIYSKWRLLESQIDRKTFQLSFSPESDLEKFRQMALLCILQYARDVDLSNSTTHCSIHNVHRVLLYYVYQMKVHLTANMFIGTIAACLRMALKHEEVPEKIRPFRESSGGIWKALGLNDPFVEGNTAYLNKVEVECLNILKDPLTPPSGPDYLDRYLTVGGWPSHLISSYREIALYLVNLSLFSRRGVDQLAGLPPSLLSASALALGIKIISAGKDDGYEFWPQRLVVYSGYGLDDLRPGVRGLSMLLRNKPPGCDILEHFHSFWAKFDWK